VIAFDSCNRARKPEDHWPIIAAAEPDLVLVIGDDCCADVRPDEITRERREPARDAARIEKT